jgi:hypothetical protein
MIVPGIFVPSEAALLDQLLYVLRFFLAAFSGLIGTRRSAEINIRLIVYAPLTLNEALVAFRGDVLARILHLSKFIIPCCGMGTGGTRGCVVFATSSDVSLRGSLA